MACIEKIYSVSVLVGNGACNGNCAFCAGKYLRQQAVESKTYEAWKRNFGAAIRLSARYGGWSLSLTGSGEPTCDPEEVTEALEIYNSCAKNGAFFPNVNLFTNGILWFLITEKLNQAGEASYKVVNFDRRATQRFVSVKTIKRSMRLERSLKGYPRALFIKEAA